MSGHQNPGRHTRRNATAFGVSAVICGLLLLYPTSTNQAAAGGASRAPLAPVGVVQSTGAAGVPSPTSYVVTGATYTSGGYIGSPSARDAAHLG